MTNQSNGNLEPSEAKKRISPKDFLRGRRPEYYSDSEVVRKSTLGRSLFEYHLESLTSRSQHLEFEHFAKSLAEKIVCPNLIPQTGPTGGGDSKVDTETFPVSEKITERWYLGNPTAGDERWAFAISAKKDWRSKVKEDVKKIIGTKRGYSKIFFVSNQYVSDKKRASLEDDLTELHSVPVRIFDRAWILDSVFKHGYEELAITLLDIDGCQSSTIRIGPRDTERQLELDELDNQINDQDRYVGVQNQLIFDCLHSAILACELDKPRIEVEGRFQRAKKIALKCGSNLQLLRITYQQAWTACFSYDDISEFSDYYSEVEKYALTSDNAFHIEKIVTLWNVLIGSSKLALDRGLDLDIQKRGDRLKKKLLELVSQDWRPNNALHAKSSLVLIEITSMMHGANKHESIEKRFVEFKEILIKSSRLGDYPFDRYETIITEFGVLFPDSKAYDELFEELLTQSKNGKVMVSRVSC